MSPSRRRSGLFETRYSERLGNRLNRPPSSLGPAPEIVEGDFVVIVKDDLVANRNLHGGALQHADGSDGGLHAAQDLGGNVEPELNLQVALLRPDTLDEMGAIVVLRQKQVNAGDVFLGVEVENQVLVIQHHLRNENVLSVVDPAEITLVDLPSPRDDRLRADVLDQDEILKPERDDGMIVGQGLQKNVGRLPARHHDGLQRLRGFDFLNGFGWDSSLVLSW